jgi:hypothetical protein
MFNLEKSIAAWKRKLRKLGAFEDGTVAELESHLRDAYDRQKLLGQTDEEACRSARRPRGRRKSAP